MKGFITEALQNRHNPTSPSLPEKKRLQHKSPKDENGVEVSNPNEIPQSMEDAAMTEASHDMQDMLDMPTL